MTASSSQVNVRLLCSTGAFYVSYMGCIKIKLTFDMPLASNKNKIMFFYKTNIKVNCLPTFSDVNGIYKIKINTEKRKILIADKQENCIDFSFAGRD